MPLVRSKTFFTLVALFVVAIFFLLLDPSSQSGLLRFKPAFDRSTTSSSPSQFRVSAAPSASASVSASSSPSSSSPVSPVSPAKPASKSCAVDPALAAPLPFAEWLLYKNYTRAYLRPRHVDANTVFSSLEDIESPVLPPFTAMGRGMPQPSRSAGGEDDGASCPPVVEVKVAADHSIEETSKLLFGLATTVDRLDNLLPSLLYSYGDSKAGILVLVPDSDDDTDLQEAYFRSRGLNLTIRKSPLEFTSRYFGLVRAFADYIRDERPWTTWVSFVDDDTFWPSLATVAEELKLFDVNRRHYIGSLSEASWQVDTFGHIAFGGAGVFVSKPLLDVLEEYYDECQSWGEQPGDQKLGQCIQRYGNAPLTLWPSLFQMDMQGAVDGVYESGRRIESLHHWNSWYHLDVVKMSTVSAAAGRRSVLRRWVFDQQEELVDAADSSRSVRSFWVLTNGYSIVKYTYDEQTPDDVINFEDTEKTWEEDAVGYEDRLGPLRPQEQEGVSKERWLLKEAFVVGPNVHQIYARDEDLNHSIIEIIWLGP